MGKPGVMHTKRTGVNRAIGSSSEDGGSLTTNPRRASGIFVASADNGFKLKKLRSTISNREPQTIYSSRRISNRPTVIATTSRVHAE